jgi:hypothetical protein
MRNALYRFELGRCLRSGFSLRDARLAALAYARETPSL